jgi:hypothetical protein
MAKNAAAQKKARKARTERKFPALTFEEALEIPEAIQKYASGQKGRRLTLFEKLNKEPDSNESRRLVTASGQYGLTKGGYQAEFLELTPEGNEATGDVVPPAKKMQARFNLAIQNHAPFNFLYQKLKGNRMPAKEVMADYLSEVHVEDDQKPECIDKFILNAKFLGLLRTIAGSERIIPVEQVLEEASTTSITQSNQSGNNDTKPKLASLLTTDDSPPTGDSPKFVFTLHPLEKTILRSAAMRISSWNTSSNPLSRNSV